MHRLWCVHSTEIRPATIRTVPTVQRPTYHEYDLGTKEKEVNDMWIYDGAWIPTYDVGKMETMILLEIMTVIVETMAIYALLAKSKDGKRSLTFLECFELSAIINILSFVIGIVILFFTGYFNIW